MRRMLLVLASVLTLFVTTASADDSPLPATAYIEAGQVAPSAGYLVPRARFDVALARLRELRAVRAEAEARQREAAAERARAEAIAGQLEQERSRRKDAEEIAAKSSRAARGQRKKNWLSWVKGIGLGLALGGLW